MAITRNYANKYTYTIYIFNLTSILLSSFIVPKYHGIVEGEDSLLPPSSSSNVLIWGHAYIVIHTHLSVRVLFTKFKGLKKNNRLEFKLGCGVWRTQLEKSGNPDSSQ